MTIWNPTLQDGAAPLYRKLADAIERDVFSGVLPPGRRLPTHRDLADALGLNVSTVTRGYAEAEKRGLVSGTVGRGTYVAADAASSVSMVSLEPRAPGLIEMGLIEPLYGLDPDVSQGLKRLAGRRNLDAFLRYADPRGLPEHRKTGADWAGRYGMKVSAEKVVVCAGAQHALTCALASLFRPGDRIAVDRLTYPGLKTLAAMLGLRLVPAPADAQGMTPRALEAACGGAGIKGVYVNPGMHNPTTARMSETRRGEIARIAQKRDLIVIEDDAYDLTLPGEAPPLASLAPERSVLVAGVSKALAAGLRVGFLAAPARFQRDLAQAVLNTVWMTPPLTVELLCQWIEDGTADRTLAAKRAEAARRYALAESALAGHAFSGRPAGFFLWLSLPAPWRGSEFEARLREHGVNVFGAEKFAVGDAPAPAAARVSLTGPADMEALRRGLGLMADLLAGRLPSPVPML